MENINKTYEKLIKTDIQLSPIILKTKTSPLRSKLNELKKINFKNHNKSHHNFKNKDFIVSKNRNISNNFNIINNNQFSLSCDIPKNNINNFTSKSIKNDINKVLAKTFYKNKNPKNNITKKDIGIQSYQNEKMRNESPKNKNFQLLTKLIDHSNNKNIENIDYILESPYRGVEKIESPLSETISSERNKNFYKPIFINNNYKGYFCPKNYDISKSLLIIKNINNRNNRNNNRNNIQKITNDKYNEIKIKKEINNPLTKLSKLSGISCSKLRKIINYSLSHRINNFGKKNIKQVDNNSTIIKHIINSKTQNNENNKCIYSIITLKSKNKNDSKSIKQDIKNIENESSFENVIGNHIFNNKTNYYFKNRNNRNNYSPISIKKDIKLFKNITIKNKIGGFYK